MLKRRFVVLWNRIRVRSEDRNARRNHRKGKIERTKKSILQDLISGHNVGDYNITRDDITDILRLSTSLPISRIEELFKKYRGNDLSYRN